MGPRSTKEPWSRVPRNLTNDANNAVRDAILNDATRFPGGDIDAAISTRAVPGDAMALTAAERLIVQALIINDLTPFAGADVAAILADTATIVWADVTSIKTQTDKWPGTDTAGSHGITTLTDLVETDMIVIAKTTRYAVSIYIDVQELIAAVEGGTVTFKMYDKIDEVNYRIVAKVDFIVGTDVVHPSFEASMINHNVKVTVQCSTDVTATRTLPYRYIIRDME